MVHKVAMSMGWNPTFTDVKAKTVEPWILHTFDEEGVSESCVQRCTVASGALKGPLNSRV